MYVQVGGGVSDICDATPIDAKNTLDVHAEIGGACYSSSSAQPQSATHEPANHMHYAVRTCSHACTTGVTDANDTPAIKQPNKNVVRA